MLCLEVTDMRHSDSKLCWNSSLSKVKMAHQLKQTLLKDRVTRLPQCKATIMEIYHKEWIFQLENLLWAIKMNLLQVINIYRMEIFIKRQSLAHKNSKTASSSTFFHSGNYALTAGTFSSYKQLIAGSNHFGGGISLIQWGSPNNTVLGLARAGLIFTGLQEGAQPGGGGWPHLAKQSPVFHTMCRHAGFRWGRRCGGKALAAWGGAASVLFRESGCCTGRGCVFSLFVSLLFLFSLCLLFC